MVAKIVVNDPDHCVAVWHRTIVEIWGGECTLRGVEAMVRTCKSVLATAEGPVTFVAILEAGSPPPSDSARKLLAEWSRDVVPQMAVAAMVAEGGGFRSAIVRGVGVALSALIPHRVPFKFFNTIDDALTLLQPELAPGSGGSSALRGQIADLRKQMMRTSSTRG